MIFKNVEKMLKIFVIFLTLLWVSGCNNIIETKKEEFTVWKTSEKLDLTDFWEVYEIIEDEYYSSDTVSKEDLVRWAIAWMVEALWDQHSEFMNPEITEKFNEMLEWDFEGIGAVVEESPLWVKIERIFKGSPAKKFGVMSWDIIIKANEFDLQDLDLYDAVEKIKGPAGTKVVLTIIRAGEDDIIEIEVVRDKIQIPSVEEEVLDDTIWYIALNLYGQSTASEFKIALKNLENQNIEGLIIDVRDNGGGYLESAVDILSNFIAEWEVLVKTKYTNDIFNTNYYSHNTGELFDWKIVVLINGNSASASEITAWALREYDKAILVWEKSYGKGSVQQPFDMEDGSLLKLTVAKWFTPKGRNIEEEWVEPDIEILFSDEDFENQYDRQLEEAKKILQLFIENETLWFTLESYEKQAEKLESVNNDS